MKASRVASHEWSRDIDPPPDFAVAYAVEVAHADRWPAPRWAQAVLEECPALVRMILRLGWRLGLGLRLRPAGSPGQIGGWEIRDASPELVDLGARARLLEAHNLIAVEAGRVVYSTCVAYRSRTGRVLWLAATPLHRVIAPRLLTRAAGALAAGTSGRG